LYHMVLMIVVIYR